MTALERRRKVTAAMARELADVACGTRVEAIQTLLGVGHSLIDVDLLVDDALFAARKKLVADLMVAP